MSKLGCGKGYSCVNVRDHVIDVLNIIAEGKFDADISFDDNTDNLLIFLWN